MMMKVLLWLLSPVEELRVVSQVKVKLSYIQSRGPRRHRCDGTLSRLARGLRLGRSRLRNYWD